MIKKPYRKRPKKNKQNNVKNYQISVLKDNNFDLSEIMAWIDEMCTGKFYYRRHKKNIVFTFFELDDGFKFKLKWEIV